MANQPIDFYILRLHGGQKSGVDWFPSGEYSENDVEGINDPSGASSRHEITSIPSPFARLHVFETAFREVTSRAHKDRSSMDGRTIYHKLVSDALDVGEVFFNYQIFKDRSALEISVWNKKEQLQSLKNDSFKEHNLLAETLELFIKQADEKSNLGEVDNFYVLSCDHRVIGGTSPTTLFFAGSGDLTFTKLGMGDDVFFDDIYFPLHRRSLDFQYYLHGLFRVNPSLSQKMPLIWAYLQQSIECLKNENIDLFKELIDKLQNCNERSFMKDFDEADNGVNGGILEVLPGIHHRRKSANSLDNLESDFTIGTYKNAGGINEKAKNMARMPLVLQNGFQKKFRYVNGIWNPAYNVPFQDERPLEMRFLPGQSEKHSYLTVSDFLEPVLIKMPFPLNEKYFFNGNTKGFNIARGKDERPDEGYLLPLTKRFFEYFDIEDLRGNTGQEVFSMEKMDNAVVVRLRIPIKKENEYLVFERTYKPNSIPEPAANRGSIVEASFSLAFIPFVDAQGLKHQRAVLATNKDDKIDISFHKISAAESSDIAVSKSTVRSNRARGHAVTTWFFEPENGFNLVCLNFGQWGSGLVVPKLTGRQNTPTKQFTFAVDFGTTNTHIEFSVNGSTPEPFYIAENKEHLIPIYDPKWEVPRAKVLQDIFLYEAIPARLGGSARYGMPFRTAASETSGFKPAQSFAIGDINIPFYFEDMSVPVNNDTEITTNLKWKKLTAADGDLNSARIRNFLETLGLLMRNKVILNDGDILRTKLVYFLPSSMGIDQLSSFKNIWNNVYRKIFLGEEEGGSFQAKAEGLSTFSESIAPFYALGEDEAKSEEYPVVSIDIGGETTDVVIFKNKVPQFLTSMKFAGNAVFGDGHATDKMQNNGFVKVFQPVVENFIKQNNLSNLEGVLNQLSDTRFFGSADVMAFFFSIEKNPTVREKKLRFSLPERLHDHPEFNMVYLVFYSAIVYHIAKLMKKLGMGMPRNLVLSGNGSKIMRLLSYDDVPLEQFTIKLFEKVYGEKYHSSGLSILRKQNPKELTAKGGIHLSSRHDFRENYDVPVLLGDSGDTIINEQGNWGTRNIVKYKDIDELMRKSVIKEVEDFIEIIRSLQTEWSYKNFGINVGNLDEYCNELKRDLYAYLMKGIEQRKALSHETETVAETLFFYPLIGSLYDLIKKIANK